jgi:plastocyanin
MMTLSAYRAAQFAIAFALLAFASPAMACDKCHAGPDGDTCAPGCTCCGGAHGSQPPNPQVTPPDPEPGVVDIAMVDYLYVPETVSVTPGTTVRWTNYDAESHDTISNDFLWHSEYIDPGKSFEYTFTDDSFQPFEYYCSLHGGMTGTITVVAPEPVLAVFAAVLSFIPRPRRM